MLKHEGMQYFSIFTCSFLFLREIIITLSNFFYGIIKYCYKYNQQTTTALRWENYGLPSHMQNF